MEDELGEKANIEVDQNLRSNLYSSLMVILEGNLLRRMWYRFRWSIWDSIWFSPWRCLLNSLDERNRHGR